MDIKRKIIFYGTPDFSVSILRALIAIPELEVGCVVTQPDKPAGRGGKIQPPPVKVAALNHQIPVIQPARIKRDIAGFLAQTDLHGPFDLGVVVAFGQILPQDLLDSATHGYVNVHASLLPRWRGAAPIQRAIIAGDKVTGVCLMKMDAGLDTGPEYSRTSLDILPDDTFHSLHDRLAIAGADLIRKDIVSIAQGQLPAIPQPISGITYADKIKNEECRLNWAESAAQIARTVRGLNPFPGAFTSLAGKRLKIFGVIPINSEYTGAPGTVVKTANDHFTVACGQGELQISDVQLEGKRRMPVAEFLRGGSITVGNVLS